MEGTGGWNGGSRKETVVDASALEAVREEVAQLRDELRETQKQLRVLQQQSRERASVEEERVKKQHKWNSLSRFVVFLVVVPIGLSIVCRRQYDSLVEGFGGTFFDGRLEYLLMFPLPSWKRHLLLSTPFLADGPRQVLEAMPRGDHDAEQVWYNSSAHDNSYRALRTQLVDSDECGLLRSLVSRHTLSHTDLNEDEESSLHLEFSHIPVYELLGMYDPTTDLSISQDEANLLIDVMNRIQQEVEAQFHSPYILLDFADITRRTSPVEQQRDAGTSWVEHWLQTLLYRSTGGHGMHADQCSMTASEDTYWNGFECELTLEHCCAYRTHSALLYFNDFSQQELRGGDLYMVDRSQTDLLDEEEPRFSGLGLGHLLSRTVRLRPECGNLIMFTSDTRNFHGTFAIERGERYAMPLWFSDLSQVPTTSLKRDNFVVYQNTWQSVLRDLRHKCRYMNRGIFPVPSAFVHMRNQHGDLDCIAIVESVREMVGFQEEEEDDYDFDGYQEDYDEDEYNDF